MNVQHNRTSYYYDIEGDNGPVLVDRYERDQLVRITRFVVTYYPTTDGEDRTHVEMWGVVVKKNGERDGRYATLRQLIDRTQWQQFLDVHARLNADHYAVEVEGHKNGCDGRNCSHSSHTS